MPFDLALLKVVPFSIIDSIIEWVRGIRVRVHVGYFPGNPNGQVFINVVNMSPTRDVEIVRVWFATSSPIDVLNPQRPLPQRLRPREPWETWMGLESLPTRHVDDLVRVQLSSGKTFASKARRDVATAGVVPGGHR